MFVTKPRVSVIVPAYNVANYISDALRSLQKQTFSDFEVIIVNDGSTDNTTQIVEEFCRQDRRLRLISQSNRGLSSARNTGILHAQGDYIALLDGDDTYHSEKLARHVAVLETNPHIGVVYSATRAICDRGQPTWMVLSGQPVHVDPVAALFCKNFIGHGSNGVFRRALIEEIGNFDENLRSNEDLDFWLRVATSRTWQFYLDRKILCYYRVRPSGLSFNVTQMHRDWEVVIRKASDRTPEIAQAILPTARAYMYRYLARLCLQAGDTHTANQWIDRAWCNDARIFYRDYRSFITLLSVRLAPLANRLISLTLGSQGNKTKPKQTI